MFRRVFRAITRALLPLTAVISCIGLAHMGLVRSEALSYQKHPDGLVGKWGNIWRHTYQLYHFAENGTFEEVFGGSSDRQSELILCSGTFTVSSGRLSLALKKQGLAVPKGCVEAEDFAYRLDGPTRLILEGPGGAMVLNRCSALPDAHDPVDKNFWGDCGAMLGAPSIADDDLRTRVKAIMHSELEDKKVVEVEVTEAVLDRINSWAKMLAFFAGIPMALLIGVLGVMGFRKYNDLSELISAAEEKIKPTIRQAEKTADDVERKTNDLKARAGEMQSQVERAEKTAGDMERATSELKKRNEDMERLFDVLEPRLKESERLAKGYEARLTEVQKAVDSRVADLEQDVNEIKDLLPGKERWPVKTGSDKDVQRVSAKPVSATVEELNALVPPKNPRSRKLQETRVAPAELTIYTVEATIVTMKLQMSGNYTLVLQGHGGATMRAQVPNPDPAFVPSSSRWAEEIAIVRKQINDHLVPTRFVTRVKIKARITGVGFFTSLHGQLGVAPNGFELHPVIGIEFLS